VAQSLSARGKIAMKRSVGDAQVFGNRIETQAKWTRRQSMDQACNPHRRAVRGLSPFWNRSFSFIPHDRQPLTRMAAKMR
jgi:hypothetical protein